jgi:hypothetical protein
MMTFFCPNPRAPDRAPAGRRGGRIDLKCFLPMFRLPELGRGAHDSRQTRQFNFIET